MTMFSFHQDPEKTQPGKTRPPVRHLPHWEPFRFGNQVRKCRIIQRQTLDSIAVDARDLQREAEEATNTRFMGFEKNALCFAPRTICAPVTSELLLLDALIFG